MFDTHCHLNFKDFKNDGHDIAKKCLKERIGLITVGSQYSTSLRAVEFANKYPQEHVYAAVGIHPTQVIDKVIDDRESGVKFKSRAELFEKNKYQKLVQQDKVVAIGEVGLDYHFIDDQSKDERLETIDLEKKRVN